VAIIVSLTIITGATRPQLAVSGAALGLGALLFFGHRWLRRNVR